MKLDQTVNDAIKEVCLKEGVSDSSTAIIRFVERYISNELPPKQYASILQDIYDSFKGSE